MASGPKLAILHNAGETGELVMSDVTLKRSISLPMIILYGLGTIIGGGVYALTGKVAGTSGLLAPIAFLVASILAGFSAFSLAELTSRFPKAAGEAVFVKEGLPIPLLSTLVGIFVIASGIISTAALAHAFSEQFETLFAVPYFIVLLLFILSIGFIAAIGVNISVGFAVLITLVEIGGLAAVVWTGWHQVPGLKHEWPVTGADLSTTTFAAIGAGAVLAFYAFIGFEDMVNMAEEVKEPKRNMPLAIIITIFLTSIVYVAISLVAVATISPDDLAQAGAPLKSVYELNTLRDGRFLAWIGMFAILNGALVQIIMAARVFYGLANQGSLPKLFASINPVTRTPVFSTALVILLITAIAIAGDLESLARATSLILLTVFALVNLALLRIKRKDPKPEGVTTVPAIVPAIGFLISAAFVMWELLNLMNGTSGGGIH